MDSDDQNSNKKCDSDDNVLMEYKMSISDEINDNMDQHYLKNQYIDGNGNQVSEKGQIQNNDQNKIVECSCMDRTTASSTITTSNTTTKNSTHPNEDSQINEKIMKKLQSMSISDDDYDESLTCNVCDRAFKCHRQLASHQQKKRHFGCNACDTLFPSLMLLEHHKEEYEHWSDSEEYHGPCCRHNRRDDFEFSDTDSCTSDAESEDLERLL
ncbi:hypothetical protein ACKWTF_012326 [Chironomus riparius]